MWPCSGALARGEAQQRQSEGTEWRKQRLDSEVGINGLPIAALLTLRCASSETGEDTGQVDAGDGEN